MKRLKLLLFLCFGLTACQPKGSWLYQYPNAASLSINELVVVIDYLNLKDDIGAYWDFDSPYHQQTLNHLLTAINQHTTQAGYPKVDTYLLSSGLLIKSPFAVDHYQGQELQSEPLYPPYILATDKINNEQIEQHQEIMTLLVKYMAQRKHHPTDESSHRGMQLGYQMAAMDLANDAGILYLHIDLSAPGIIKQTATFLLAGAAANQADYASVHMNVTPRRQASAFLVHKGSGQILWKNHSKNWRPDQSISSLLVKFPSPN